MSNVRLMIVHYERNDFKFEEFVEVLSKMSNVRLMIINRIYNVCFPNDRSHLDVPNKLRHLSWRLCPSKCLSSNSQPMEFVHLELQYSCLKYLWQGVMVILFNKLVL